MNSIPASCLVRLGATWTVPILVNTLPHTDRSAPASHSELESSCLAQGTSFPFWQVLPSTQGLLLSPALYELNLSRAKKSLKIFKVQILQWVTLIGTTLFSFF
jgi:hypothetical protein